MKKLKIILPILFAIIIGFLLVYPTAEIKTKDKLIAFRYSDNLEEFETEIMDNENYFYYNKYDISIGGVDFKKFLFFHVIEMEYVEGNMCDEEYVLEESYIQNFLENAEIEENLKNINWAEMIKGKKAIVGNKKYPGNDYETEIWYILDGKHEVMYIYQSEDVLAIQVGLSDEGPKYIAYK